MERGWKYLGTSIGINNRWRKARFRFGDVSGIDLALVSTDYAGPVKCASLAEDVPANGASVRLVGYPKHKGKREHTGTIGWPGVVGLRLKVNVGSIEGDSGGGIFSGSKLIGIIARTDGSATYATVLTDLKYFVTQKLGSLPVCGKPTEVVPQPPKEDGPPRPDPPVFDPTSLQNKIEALRKRIAELEVSKPKDGKDGKNGKRGPPGVTTVEVIRNGKLSETTTGVESGSTVRVIISDKEK